MVVALAVALAVLIIMPVLGIDVATITDGRQCGRQHSCSCQHGSNNNNK